MNSRLAYAISCLFVFAFTMPAAAEEKTAEKAVPAAVTATSAAPEILVPAENPKTVYACPMCKMESEMPGKCPKCNIDLKEKATAAPQKPAYECPMCKVSSSEPGKCPKCGMDMTAVPHSHPNGETCADCCDKVGEAKKFCCKKCGTQSDKKSKCCGSKMKKNKDFKKSCPKN